MKKSLWGNTIVKNEDKFLWFAVKSTIEYLDKLIIYDTGSTDRTLEIIDLLKKEYPDKITFKEYGLVNETEFTKARQEMLEQTKGDWLLVLDGDEVWWEGSIKEVRRIIDEKEDDLELLVSRTINPVGDIYHYQEEEAGNYQVMGQKGHFNVRVISRTIPGLHVDRPYGSEGYFDEAGKPIQDRDERKFMMLDKPYLHLSFLQRSSLGDSSVMQRGQKRKVELGTPFPADFSYPEVFYLDRPKIVDTPWKRMDGVYTLAAFFQTPLKKLKRRIMR